MAWHTKYRPHAVSELHITEVRDVLLQLMKSGNFPRVFLCAGPKGTGKTSTARIIGAMLNDPANQDSVTLSEPDPTSDLSKAIFAGASFVVQEMDAASNRGIDDIRQLKERVALPPQGARVAVYILDEVHMLTTEAFNALLKILEEPPAHAVFVLATTEQHKVPATIQSRCTILPFRMATAEELSTALAKVAKAEKLELSKTALSTLSQLADGSFRDAIKNLELVAAMAAGKPITDELIETTLKSSFMMVIPELVKAVTDRDEQQVVVLIEELRAKGVNSVIVHKALLSFLHQDLLKNLGVVAGEAQFNQRITHFLLQELQGLSASAVEPLPLLALELKLLDLVFRAKDKSGAGSGNATAGGSSGTAVKGEVTKGSTKKNTSEKTVSAVKAVEPTLEHVQIVTQDQVLTHNHVDTKPLLASWPEFVSAVEQRNSTLAAFLRSAKPLPEESNGTAKVEVYYQFHKDQLMQPKCLDVLQQCAESMLGGRPGFEFVLALKQTESDAQMQADVADSLLV